MLPPQDTPTGSEPLVAQEGGGMAPEVAPAGEALEMDLHGGSLPQNLPSFMPPLMQGSPGLIGDVNAAAPPPQSHPHPQGQPPSSQLPAPQTIGLELAPPPPPS